MGLSVAGEESLLKFSSVAVVFHGSGIGTGIVKDGAVRINEGKTVIAAFHIFQIFDTLVLHGGRGKA